MKKWIANLVMMVALLAISIYAYTNFIAENNSNDLAKVFDEANEIYQDASIVVRAEFPKEYDVIDNGSKKAVYDINILEVLKNDSKVAIARNDTIPFSQHFSYTDSSSGNETFLLKKDEHDIKTGEYLLFLNTYEQNGSNEFVSNTPNHLYQKITDGRYQNIRGSSLKILNLQNLY
ncbi:hypothetical protein [Paenisporosarcina cavernae]|uniref:Uncharacterized protein n=1 Tax=Paenisporosarcina cavernae TaxID=2320858 RepID=A0A385YXH2_9BACL|nr:hypothetical protein [Paenisporosarcina cavernae]AYC30273.1 hypothetical protein D3873_10575 [Paenisporosarcina cavernae]